MIFEEDLHTYIEKNVNRANKRAEKKGRDFGITIDDMVDLWNEQQGKCAMTDMVMTHVVGKGKITPTNGSIDRIDSNKGYVKDNVQWVCTEANRMKGKTPQPMFNSWVDKISNKNKQQTIINER